MDEDVTAEALIERAILKVKDGPGTRASALTITKLEEAAMWFMQHRKELQAAAKRSGFTPAS